MYERLLDKKTVPTVEELTEYCKDTSDLFTQINNWMTAEFGTERKIVFPYGNNYGWGISHKKKGKLICNVFAENSAFTVMMRLSERQFASVYERLSDNAKKLTDNKYPCGDGGWIHYRVKSTADFDDIKVLLSVKLS